MYWSKWSIALMYAIFIGVFLYNNRVEACNEVHYQLYLGSKHIDSNKKFNEVNPGLGVECDNLQTGVFYNSIRNVSVYVGSALPVYRRAGIKYGFVTGYRLPVVPYITGYVRAGVVEFTIIPPTPYSPLTVGYSVRW